MAIKNEDHIVVYDHSDTYSSCRLWFALKYFGHKKVSVLDGGMKKWLAENRSTDNKINKDLGKFSNIDKLNHKNKYEVKEKTDLIKNKKQIDENLKKISFKRLMLEVAKDLKEKLMSLDQALEEDCIVGSKNLPFKDCINAETNTFKSKEELSKIFIKNNIDISKPIVFTCGSGMTACVLGMAYSIISGKSAVVYDGSWSEYGKSMKRSKKVTIGILIFFVILLL